MISGLLAAPRAADEVVAFGREGTRRFGELRRDVAALARRLPPLPGRRVLLHAEDAYAFAVGLLAAGQARACAVLPPSRQPGALRAVADRVELMLLDGADAPAEVAGRPCLHPLAPGREDATGEAPATEPLARDLLWVEMFTSGTTGDARVVPKALRHLGDEVALLEAHFAPVLGPGARMLATMSPQHLYGLLFRVLWPLASGRPFLRSPLLHPGEFAPHLDVEEPFALASTPVALRHLVEKGELELRAPACRAVFASGGPLPAAVARSVAQAVGAPPFEIYGSTETGGVAVRQQHRGDEAWRPLPGVEVAADPETGRVAVTSPFVSIGTPFGEGRARFVLGDVGAFAGDGSFRLRGRADRVVKIGEKRLSLPDMETRLAAHPAVAEVALAALPALPGGEPRVGAVVVPTAEGRGLLEAGGRRALTKVLGEHLASDFDRVLLPRAWRVVEALPRDAQGKTPAAALRRTLAQAEDEPAPSSPARPHVRPDRRAAPREPEVHGRRREAGAVEVLLRIPEDLAFLEGHFPGQPVVAGVVQVHFAMQALEELVGASVRLVRLEALKFHVLLRPGDRVRLRVEREPGAARFCFQLADAERPERIFAQGRGQLAAPTPPGAAGDAAP